jgi:hypothetical protein
LYDFFVPIISPHDVDHESRQMNKPRSIENVKQFQSIVDEQLYETYYDYLQSKRYVLLLHVLILWFCPNTESAQLKAMFDDPSNRKWGKIYQLYLIAIFHFMCRNKLIDLTGTQQAWISGYVSVAKDFFPFLMVCIWKNQIKKEKLIL